MSSQGSDSISISDSDLDLSLDDFEGDHKDNSNKQAKNIKQVQNKTREPTKKESSPSPSNATPNKKSAVSTSISSSKAPAGVNISANIDITKGPPVSTEASAKKLIMQYMTLQNRPYSVIQIFDNLHGRIPKPTVQRVMDVLSSATGGLKVKEYGKAKIYYLDQDNLSSDHTASDLANLDSEIRTLKGRLDELQQQEATLQERSKTLLDEPTDTDLDKAIEETQRRVEQYRQRVSAISSGNTDPKALENAVAAYNVYRKAWKERKDRCSDLAGTVADSTNKRVRDVMGEMGLETDEDEGVTLPPLLAESNKKIR
eukprot:gene8887-18400_t